MSYILGIDPGLTGALAFLDGEGKCIRLCEMPTMATGVAKGVVKTKVNSAEVTRLILEGPASVTVFLEDPDPMPAFTKNGKMVHMPAASAKSMGRSIGVIEGICAAMGLPVYLVKPAQWKKALNLPRDKEVARARAIEWYPTMNLGRKKDHNKAEALLIARYGLQQSQRVEDYKKFVKEQIISQSTPQS